MAIHKYMIRYNEYHSQSLIHDPKAYVGQVTSASALVESLCKKLCQGAILCTNHLTPLPFLTR